MYLSKLLIMLRSTFSMSDFKKILFKLIVVFHKRKLNYFSKKGNTSFENICSRKYVYSKTLNHDAEVNACIRKHVFIHVGTCIRKYRIFK